MENCKSILGKGSTGFSMSFKKHPLEMPVESAPIN
jgi:hypothetical protein